MHTEFHIPPAVQKLGRSKFYVCIKLSTVTWMKRKVNRHQRRYMRQLIDGFCHDPEPLLGRGPPRPTQAPDHAGHQLMLP